MTHASVTIWERALRTLRQPHKWLLFSEHAVFAVVVVMAVRFVLRYGLRGALTKLTGALLASVRQSRLGGAIIKRELNTQLKAATAPLKQQLGITYKTLPTSGLPVEELVAMLRKMRSQEESFHSRRSFGGIYGEIGNAHQAQAAAFEVFVDSNALYPATFPGLLRMELELLQMCAALLNGPPTACGTMNTGGTESILLATKAYKSMASKARGVTGNGDDGAPRFEMIVPISAHAAFAKASDYFNIKFVECPLDADFRADVRAMRRLITPNTIMLVGSAPTFSQGVIDPIGEIGALAQEFNIPFHVDACLGGFLLPFLEKLGEKFPVWDFRVPGVTSITADIHKYGFGPKGAALLLYRTGELRMHQFYQYTEWTGGIYASPSMTGSRSGGIIAAAWSAVLSLGEEGYLRAAAQIRDEARKYQDIIRSIPELNLMGTPVACIVAFEYRGGDVYKIAEAMQRKGWHNINRAQRPKGCMMQIGAKADFDIKAFGADLAQSVKEVVTRPGDFADGSTALYGTASAMPDRGLVSDMLASYLDAVYST